MKSKSFLIIFALASLLLPGNVLADGNENKDKKPLQDTVIDTGETQLTLPAHTRIVDLRHGTRQRTELEAMRSAQRLSDDKKACSDKEGGSEQGTIPGGKPLETTVIDGVFMTPSTRIPHKKDVTSIFNAAPAIMDRRFKIVGGLAVAANRGVQDYARLFLPIDEASSVANTRSVPLVSGSSAKVISPAASTVSNKETKPKSEGNHDAPRSLMAPGGKLEIASLKGQGSSAEPAATVPAKSKETEARKDASTSGVRVQTPGRDRGLYSVVPVAAGTSCRTSVYTLVPLNQDRSSKEKDKPVSTLVPKDQDYSTQGKDRPVHTLVSRDQTFVLGRKDELGDDLLPVNMDPADGRCQGLAILNSISEFFPIQELGVRRQSRNTGLQFMCEFGPYYCVSLRGQVYDIVKDRHNECVGLFRDADSFDGSPEVHPLVSSGASADKLPSSVASLYQYPDLYPTKKILKFKLRSEFRKVIDDVFFRRDFSGWRWGGAEPTLDTVVNPYLNSRGKWGLLKWERTDKLEKVKLNMDEKPDIIELPDCDYNHYFGGGSALEPEGYQKRIISVKLVPGIYQSTELTNEEIARCFSRERIENIRLSSEMPRLEYLKRIDARFKVTYALVREDIPANPLLNEIYKDAVAMDWRDHKLNKLNKILNRFIRPKKADEKAYDLKSDSDFFGIRW